MKWAALLAVLAGSIALVLPGTASADSPSDPRATFHDAANATTCADVGFPSSTILGSGGSPQANGTVTADANYSVTISAYTGVNAGADSQKINVAILKSGFVIDAIVVKAGNGYNQYPSIVSDMIAPLNNGGNVPGISHWFLCYHTAPPPPQQPQTQGGAVTAATPVTVAANFTG
jgi:hypothetical protein